MPETPNPPLFATQLRQLRSAYIAVLPDALESVERRWRSLTANWGRVQLDDYHQLIHGLAGSSASYGLAEIGRLANQLAVELHALQTSQRAPDEGQLVALAEIVERLGSGMRSPLGRADIGDAAWPSHPRQQQQIVVALHSEELLSDLATQLTYFGYRIHATAKLDAARDLVLAVQPQVLVIGMAFPEGELAGAALVRQLQLNRLKPLPTIFLSERRDLSDRLEAVRAGGSGFFPLPIDTSSLVDMLDRLSGQRTPEPYRILIVEDSPMVGALYAAALRHAEIQPLVVSDPTQVMAQLDEFRPDLLLMDVYMPGCSGPELASVIRQHPDFLSLPIVFLSGETDPQAQLAAMRQGGDDFLTKPIPIPTLIGAVVSRIARSRGVRAQMIRDGLTGLLNHSAIEHQLELEIARARRNHTPLTVALLDIDHFKQVNDLYGHQAGDRVIKGLARLLQQRLRRSDSIGRYGGEEFAILMPDTEGVHAHAVLDSIRVAFAQVRHQADGMAFTTTVSCGVASFPTISDAKLLMGAADAALYRAKHGGRDRTVLSTAQPTALGLRQMPDSLVRPLATPHVLIATADTPTSETLQVWLTSRRCDVTWAATADAATAQLASAMPDVVLLSPSLLGAAALREAASAADGDPTIVMLVDASDQRGLRQGLADGAVDYLRTPLEGREFQLIFDRVIARLIHPPS